MRGKKETKRIKGTIHENDKDNKIFWAYGKRKCKHKEYDRLKKKKEKGKILQTIQEF